MTFRSIGEIAFELMKTTTRERTTMNALETIVALKSEMQEALEENRLEEAEALHERIVELEVADWLGVSASDAVIEEAV